MIVRFKLFGEQARAIDLHERPAPSFLASREARREALPLEGKTIDYNTKVILRIKSVEDRTVVEGEFEI